MKLCRFCWKNEIPFYGGDTCKECIERFARESLEEYRKRKEKELDAIRLRRKVETD